MRVFSVAEQGTCFGQRRGGCFCSYGEKTSHAFFRQNNFGQNNFRPEKGACEAIRIPRSYERGHLDLQKKEGLAVCEPFGVF